jgi:hypothetical protein
LITLGNSAEINLTVYRKDRDIIRVLPPRSIPSGMQRAGGAKSIHENSANVKVISERLLIVFFLDIKYGFIFKYVCKTGYLLQ